MIKVTLALEWFRRGIREDNWCWDRCAQCEDECWMDGGECHKEYLEVSKWKWIGYAWIRCWYKPWSWFIPYDIWERSVGEYVCEGNPEHSEGGNPGRSEDKKDEA